MFDRLLDYVEKHYLGTTLVVLAVLCVLMIAVFASLT